jgi:hypothetical protein
MGIDATLFVLAPFSDDVGYVYHSFRLQRDSDLTGTLENKLNELTHKTWTEIQLPQGDWSTFAGGGKWWPEDRDDWERGYLQEDCYGNALKAFKGKHLAEVVREEDGAFPDRDDSLNKAMFAFIVEHFPEHDVVVFFH